MRPVRAAKVEPADLADAPIILRCYRAAARDFNPNPRRSRSGVGGLTQTVFAPINRWRNSNQFSKHAVQLGCIAKSHCERHVSNR